MNKYFKFIFILVALLFCADGNTIENGYQAKMVSSPIVETYSSYKDNQDVLKANVMIFNKNYSSFLGFKYKENNTYGSGVIYNSDDEYYYVLTNNHVIGYDYSCNTYSTSRQ